MTTKNRFQKTGKVSPSSAMRLIFTDVQLWVPLAVLAAGLLIMTYVR